VIYLLAFMDRTNIGIAAPSMIQRLELTGAATGVLLSAFFWGYVLTMIPGGMLSSRASAVRVISWSIGIVGMTACLTGIVGDFTLLLGVRFFMGLAEGVLFPSFAVMFLRWFPSQERGRAFAATLLAVPVSAMIAAPLGGWLIATWNYETMFVAQGVPAIIAAVVFARLASDDPSTDTRITVEERAYILATRDQETKKQGSFRDVLTSPLVWVLGFTYFLWVSGIYGFNLWLPALVTTMSQSGVQAVGFLSAIPFIFGAVGTFVVSWLSDRSSLARGWFIGIPIAIAAIALLLQHYLNVGLVGDMILLSVAGFGIFAGSGPWWTWMTSLFPKNQAGPTVGLINVFGNFGGIVAPPMLGVIGGAAGAGSAFYILGYFGLVATLIVAVVSVLESRRRRTRTSMPIDSRSMAYALDDKHSN
jgi:sugar phosphate permease